MIVALALTDAAAPSLDPAPFAAVGVDPLTADCALLYAQAPDDGLLAVAFAAAAPEAGERRALIAAARAQDAVINAAFAGGDVLPLRFGAGFRDLAAARAGVATDAMTALWRRARGVAEWTLDAALSGPDSSEGPEDDAPGGYLRRKAALRAAVAAREAAGVQLAGAVDAALAATAPTDWAGPAPRGEGRRWTIRAPRDGDWADRVEAALNAAVAKGSAPAGARFDLRGPAPPYGVTA